MECRVFHIWGYRHRLAAKGAEGALEDIRYELLVLRALAGLMEFSLHDFIKQAKKP